MEIVHNNDWNQGVFTARKERLAKKAETEQIKVQAMADLAGQPVQQTSPLLYLIPVAGIIVIGAIILMSRKRK